MFFLINTLISLGLGAIETLLGIVGILSGLYVLAVFIPGIAVTVRRLHDIGRTGWWILISLVPVIGAIVLFVFMVLDSEAGSNQYGPNPKSGAEPAASAAVS